jgi:hypothetical protein
MKKSTPVTLPAAHEIDRAGGPMTTTDPTQALFEAIIAAWDEPLRCQTTQSPRGCRLPARWLAVPGDNCGGSVPVCTFHKNRWLRIAQEVFTWHGDVGCEVCHRRFKTVDAVYTFRPL